MGKDKSNSNAMKLRHDPLGKQIHDSENSHMKKRNRVGKLSQANKDKQEEEQVESYIPKELSKKILSQIREQALEAEQEQREKQKEEGLNTFRQEIQSKILNFTDFVDELDQPVTNKETIGDEFDENDSFEQFSDTESQFGAGEVDIDEEDEKVLAMFMGGFSQNQTRFTLGDIIESKLKEQQEMSQSVSGNSQSSRLNPKVIEVYTKVGKLLETYTSGKVPRAFRILPNFQNWEDLLYLTRPDKWTPHSIRVATKLFCMGQNPKITQRFLALVVLPRVRDNIAEFKKLNVHLYMALKKSLYRPSAFYKAVLLPLAESGDCTLLEAKIIGSIITKVSIPVLHSSVALMKLAQNQHYSGATSLFIRVLCDKKYALPYPVIDALVAHFVSFQHDQRSLPVLWHRALLSFAQRYKTDITKDQKDQLKPVLRLHNHHIITNEIRRELFSSNSRGGILPTPQEIEMK
ncbi:bystin [Tieghemostelium lacteum]|uniref:Bystin n=1 Tax=Tieghemostelium lacteum TaxID=361077 RepID=A0A152A281_TIELA|nr:bystin [Tieghemostelium lacteum]|eukprot:KYR00363.1 bystin [Tieghemostelium lacteum]